MTKADTARVIYTSVKDEVLTRIRLRDQALFIYLGAVGTVVGVALGSQGQVDLLLLLPYLALGGAVIVSQHHVLIGNLGVFIVLELDPCLEESDEAAPNWENSASFAEHLSKTIWKRAASHFVLIGIPPVASQTLIWRMGFTDPPILQALWWLGVLITLLSIGIMGRASRLRQHMFDRCDWRSFAKDGKT